MTKAKFERRSDGLLVVTNYREVWASACKRPSSTEALLGLAATAGDNHEVVNKGSQGAGKSAKAKRGGRK
jgi:hypothetical protein